MRSKLKSKYIYSINSYWMIWANKMQKPIDKQVLIFWAIRPNARRELFIFCLLRKLIIDFKQFNTKVIFYVCFFFLLSMLFCHLSVLVWMSLFFFVCLQFNFVVKCFRVWTKLKYSKCWWVPIRISPCNYFPTWT